MLPEFPCALTLRDTEAKDHTIKKKHFGDFS